jgi:hypothetical protein
MNEKLKTIETGFHICLDDGEKDLGAVRRVAPGGRDEIIVYIQNGGNFIVPLQAIRRVQDGRVILDRSGLDERLSRAISRAHEQVVTGR